MMLFTFRLSFDRGNVKETALFPCPGGDLLTPSANQFLMREGTVDIGSGVVP